MSRPPRPALPVPSRPVQNRAYISLLLLLFAPSETELDMTSDETIAVLRARRDLTGETFNDGTVHSWAEALDAWPFAEVRVAVVHASRDHNRVTVAHVVERLPRRERDEQPPEQCDLCNGTGWVESPPERAHNPNTCHPTDERPCRCHAVEPCRCTTGQHNHDTAHRIHAYNDRTKRAHQSEHRG